MAKLIDGSAMLNRVKTLYDDGHVDLSYYNIVKEAIQMETPIDAVPVRMGVWKYYTNDENKARWKCSGCGKVCRRNPADKLYCSTCGARMRKEA